MAAYLMADVSVPDMQAYRDSGYLDTVPAIAARHGGVYRMRGGDFQVLEGDWTPVRMVMIEFPSMANLLAFYEDEAYARYRAIRQRLTASKVVAFEAPAGSLPDPA